MPSELGMFLRARRERVTPEQVGLPGGGRRRTPGLRREELALLANISVDYLVRLEQGRDQSPSAAVLAALCDVLQLSEDERQHLKRLASRVTNAEMCPNATGDESPVSVAVRTMVERLHPMPAFVLSPLGDVLVWNEAFDRLMRPTGLLDGDPANVLRYTFLAPESRVVFRDWEALATEQVSNLRASAMRWFDDSTEALVGELSVRSPDFARLWARHDVGEKRTGVKRLAHPIAGDVTVGFEALALGDHLERRLVAYTAADETSARRLDALVGEPATGPDAVTPPRLRIVGEAG